MTINLPDRQVSISLASETAAADAPGSVIDGWAERLGDDEAGFDASRVGHYGSGRRHARRSAGRCANVDRSDGTELADDQDSSDFSSSAAQYSLAASTLGNRSL